MFDKVRKVGAILPATSRIPAFEMEKECFTTETGTNPIWDLYPSKSPEFGKALEEIARERISELPARGSGKSLFNCTDLIAGDLDLVFLSVGGWYMMEEGEGEDAGNGFVFDATQLLEEGGMFRTFDLLGFFGSALEQLASMRYASVAEAKEDIRMALKEIMETRQLSGEDAIGDIWDCVGKAGDYSGNKICPGEIVWPGPLSLELALEGWRDGKKVF